MSEVLAVPRILKEAELAGLQCGPAYDLARMRLDMSDSAKRVLEDINLMQPELVVLCPPCGLLSIMQNMNQNRGSSQWVKERAKARVMLRP